MDYLWKPKTTVENHRVINRPNFFHRFCTVLVVKANKESKGFKSFSTNSQALLLVLEIYKRFSLTRNTKTRRMLFREYVKMKGILVLLTLWFLSLTGCDSFQGSKKIKVRDGRELVVRFNDTISAGEERKILIVRYQYPETVKKIRRIDNDAFDIWQGMKSVADSIEVDEAVIILTTPVENEEDKSFIYAADRTEVGSWTVKKAN